MQVSVIIPSYKPGSYICGCLKSIKRQTLSISEYEVIIILNGCNEPFYSKIRNYINNLFPETKNIHLLQTDKPGVSIARNLGIDRATGEYITFVDDDDIISPSYLEDLLKVSSPTCIGCSNSYAFVKDIEEKRRNFLTIAYNRCLGLPFSLFKFRQFLSPPYAKLIHRNIIGNTRFSISLRKSEDSLFCFMISPNVRHMKLAAASAIYFQRLRPGSAMRKKQSIVSIIREHSNIERKYIGVWVKNPLRYNFLFFISRLIACGKNCLNYLKRQRAYS